MSLTAKDKKVIERFTDRAGIGLHSRTLVTDGHRLDIYGLGGHGVAEWKGGKIVLRPLGGLFEQKIHRYIRKIVPKNWLAREIKGPKRKARLDTKGTARPRSRIVGRFPIENVIGPMMSPPGGYEYRKTSRDTRRGPKKRALESLERAWVQHFKSGSLRAKHGGQRVHDAMQAAFQAGATDAEIDKVMDRAGELTARHRGEQYRKYSATGGERRDLTARATSPRRSSVRKTRDIYVVQGNYGYGHGWEDLTAASTRIEGKGYLKDYRDNESGTPFRLIKRREKL
jgi:hypothetical protein